MNRLMRMIGCGLCLVAVVATLGGHWFALQSIAWGRMIAEFSRHDSVGTAIAKTFSGRFPCSLCLEVRKGWHQENQQREKLPWLKIEKSPEFIWQLCCLAVPPPSAFALYERAFVPERYSDFIDSPPTPPPRGCFAVL